MTFMGSLMMYNTFSVMVYEALNRVHIFRPIPTSWAPIRTSIETGRSRVAAGGPTNFLYKGSEICGPK